MTKMCITSMTNAQWFIQKLFLLFVIYTLQYTGVVRCRVRTPDLAINSAELLSNYVPGADPGAAVCRTVPGLTRAQLELCQRRSDVTIAALDGLKVAVQECQHQFRWNRWNCSSLTTKNNNPHNSVFFQRGYRESAFAYAISAAGVAHSVARACSQGRLISCGCDPNSYKHKKPAGAGSGWKWGGCSHNLQYGVEFSKMFLDSREQAGDIHSRTSLHNNQAGRLAVANNVQIRCKCHGMSGSCELKTCWKAAPDFRHVGKVLKNRFRSALLVDQSNNNGLPTLNIRPRERKRQKPRAKLKPLNVRKRKRDISTELMYYQKSPNFCERNLPADIPGTIGRQCNRTSIGQDGCGSLCCGRGYNLIKHRRVERCNCKFHWCCKVECQNCTVEEWITVCK